MNESRPIIKLFPNCTASIIYLPEGRGEWGAAYHGHLLPASWNTHSLTTALLAVCLFVLYGFVGNKPGAGRGPPWSASESVGAEY